MGDVSVTPHRKCGFFRTMATGSVDSLGPFDCLVEARFVVVFVVVDAVDFHHLYRYLFIVVFLWLLSMIA